MHVHIKFGETPLGFEPIFIKFDGLKVQVQKLSYKLKNRKNLTLKWFRKIWLVDKVK